MKKLMKMVMIGVLSVALSAMAETELINGYLWDYHITDNGAVVDGVSPASGAVTIPAALGGMSVSGIGATAFSYCYNLTKVAIPWSVVTIGKNAFSGCAGLEEITIPPNVTDIGDEAFIDCSSLTHVRFLGPPPNRGGPLPSVSAPNGYSQTGLDIPVIPTTPTITVRSIFDGCSSHIMGYYSTTHDQAWKQVLTSENRWKGLPMNRVSAGRASDSLEPEKVYAEWVDSVVSKNPLKVVVVGEEEVYIKDITGNVYNFKNSNAQLVKTIGGWKLILFGATIGGRGIQSLGDLAIETAVGTANLIAITSYREQCVSSDDDEFGFLTGMDDQANGINVQGNLLIYGLGTLTISNLCTLEDGSWLFASSTPPCGIKIGRFGWNSGDLSIGGGCSLKINTAGFNAIHIDNGGDVSIVGAHVEMTGGCGIHNADKVTAVGAVLNVLSLSGSCIVCNDSATFDCVFGVFVAKAGNGIYSKGGGVRAVYSMMNVLSSKAPGVSGKDCYLGSGTYKFATDGKSSASAIHAIDSLEIEDAKVKCCTPGGAGIKLDAKNRSPAVLRMYSGLVRQVGSMDIRDEFMFSSDWIDTMGLLASWSSVAGESAGGPFPGVEFFLGYTMLNFIETQGIHTPSGEAEYGICGDDAKLLMSDGTILPEASRNGVHMNAGVVICGGSLKGPISGLVTDDNDNKLVCVTNVVAGIGSFQKVKSGWSSNLPSYYSTDSLYCDADSQLYFWVPTGYGGNGETDPGAPGYEIIEAADIVIIEAADIVAPYVASKAMTLQGVVYDSGKVVGSVELKLGKVNAKKKTSKVSGSVTTLDGKKHVIKAFNITEVDGTAPKAVALEVKDFGTMSITIGGTQFAGSMGKYHVQSAAVGGNWSKSGTKVYVDATSAALPAGTLEELLPDGEPVAASGGKWKFAKAANVKWAKPKKGAAQPERFDAESGKGLVVDTSVGKTNLSGMKLTYMPKKGTFRGRFKVYALEGAGKMTKLKKYIVNVSGVVVDGVGYGTATCKRPAVSWAVKVE